MDRKGFTLIEAMIATSVLFIGIAAVMATMSTSFQITAAAEEQNRVITAISMEAERLRSLELFELEAMFGADFIGVYTFYVDGLRGIDGSESATGTITAFVPDPARPGDLIEFTIRVDYKGELSATDFEEITVWVSPDF